MLLNLHWLSFCSESVTLGGEKHSVDWTLNVYIEPLGWNHLPVTDDSSPKPNLRRLSVVVVVVVVVVFHHFPSSKCLNR